MIKGCQRKVIVVKGDDESIFESAYFVLKNGPKYDNFSEGDMVEEADRIIRESGQIKDKKSDKKDEKKEKNYKKIIVPFSIGTALGSLLGLLWLFL